MLRPYEAGVAALKQYWIDNSGRVDTGKSVALNELRRYLQCKSIPYSHEFAMEWLSENKINWKPEKFRVSRRTVFELNDVFTIGTVSAPHKYKYDETPFDRLSVYWQEIINQYHGYLALTKTENNIRIPIRHCINLAAFFDVSNITSAKDLTGLIIAKYYSSPNIAGDSYKNIHSTRRFLEYLVNSEGIDAHIPYVITSHTQAEALWYSNARTHNNIFEDDSHGISPPSYFSNSLAFVQYMIESHHYDKAGLRSHYTHYFQMYYVFCSENKILCNKETERFWFSVMSEFFEAHKQTFDATRAFRLLNIYNTKKEITLDEIKDHNRNKGAITRLNDDFVKTINAFSVSRQKEFFAKSTVVCNRWAAISFFSFIQDHGIKDVLEITHKTVKDYCVWASNNSTTKKNSYASDLRALLSFLFEKEYTIKDLSTAVPVQISQTRKIIDILSDEEIEKIYHYRENAHTTLELRNSAVLMLGLLMGLRRIDIVNLKESDIDWKNKTISITQKKTYRPLVIPMPIPAGNSIYLYMKHGRPDVDSEYIFFTERAPYKPVGTSACSKAMLSVLPERNVDFHILRRTFASRLLRSKADIDTIKDSMGHSNLKTIHRYLSTDDKSMVECCIPLERTVEK